MEKTTTKHNVPESLAYLWVSDWLGIDPAAFPSKEGLADAINRRMVQTCGKGCYISSAGMVFIGAAPGFCVTDFRHMEGSIKDVFTQAVHDTAHDEAVA